MNELILSNEKQAIRLAQQLRQELSVSDVRLYRASNGQFRLTYNCQITAKQDQQLARAERAVQMADQGYQVVWLGDNGLVVGPLGQLYSGSLEQCSCTDMQLRLANEDNQTYKGACKHALYRAVDLLVRGNRALRERPASKPTRRRQPKAKVAAAV